MGFAGTRDLTVILHIHHHILHHTLHHHSMYHMCMDIPSYMAGTDFSNRVILFKSLIANMAGFLLWLSITCIMIKVFKVALAQWLSYYQWI